MNESGNLSSILHRYLTEEEYVFLDDVLRSYHAHSIPAHQCSSIVAQQINAPISTVWSVVRRFDRPQIYNQFIRNCQMKGDGSVGSIRELDLISGIPARSSTERLEILDDDNHVLSFRVLGGEHRLQNYTSTTTVHEMSRCDKTWTIVLESYVVDIPEGNSREDTCIFGDTIVNCNLHSLAHVCEHLALHQQRDPRSTVASEA